MQTQTQQCHSSNGPFGRSIAAEALTEPDTRTGRKINLAADVMAVPQMKDTGQTTHGLADPAHLFPFGCEELRRVKQDVSGFPAACARSMSTSTQAKNSFPMRNPGSSHSFRSQGLSDVERKGCGCGGSGSPRHMDLMSRRTFGVTRYFSALAAVVRERKVWLGFLSDVETAW